MTTDRDIHEYLPVERKGQLDANERDEVAAYDLVYQALRQKVPYELPERFAEALADRLLGPPRTLAIITGILPEFVSLLVIGAIAFISLPQWVGLLGDVLRSEAYRNALSNLAEPAVLVAGFVVLGFLDHLLGALRGTRHQRLISSSA